MGLLVKTEAASSFAHTHRGIEIRLSSSGSFFALVGDKVVYKPSLQSMKNAIDKKELKAFKTFKALTVNPTSPGLVQRVNILGVRRVRERWWSNRHGTGFSFVVRENPTSNYSKVLVDSPKNIKARKARRNYEAETDRIMNARHKEQSRLNDTVKYHYVKEFLK